SFPTRRSSDLGAAHRRAWRGGFKLRRVKAEIGDDAAHPAYARFHAVFVSVERGELAALDLIERTLQAVQRIVDALIFGQLAWWRTGEDRRKRFQPRFAIR